MSLDEVREIFKRAVGILVDEDRGIKDRLLIAYASQLALIRAAADLPESLRDDFQGLRYALSDADLPYGYGERAVTKLRDMTSDQAADAARLIFAMYVRLGELARQPVAPV